MHDEGPPSLGRMMVGPRSHVASERADAGLCVSHLRRARMPQSWLTALASADFLLAAWFWWMTPLLAALSS